MNSEVINAIILNPIKPLKKVFVYFSSANESVKPILIILSFIFFPIIFTLFIFYIIIAPLIIFNKLLLKITLKQKEKKKEREELIKEQERRQREREGRQREREGRQREREEELIKEQERRQREREGRQREREGRQREREEERIIHENNSKQFESELISIIKGHSVIIDSNLWMDYDFESFFGGLLTILNKYEYILNLCAAQLYEIHNIKTKPKYSGQGNKANKAIKRIEKYQVEKVLKINSISCREDKKAYADPAILEYLISEYPKNGGITLITNDKTLRVRARQVFEDKGFSNYNVL